MTTTRFAFAAEGNSSLFRAVADAMDDTVGGFYRSLGWHEDHSLPTRIPAMFQDQRVRNASAAEMAGLFSVFVISCFGKKIFDELYERTAKRPVGEFLDKLLARVQPPKAKFIEFRDVIYLEDIETVVVIRSLINPDRTADVQDLHLQGHRVAHAYLERHGRVAPVHCHTIEDGKVELEPKLYVSIAQLDNEIRKPMTGLRRR